mmetsp:Transcript_120222/g.221110  ORF Transcript_120222/g.221110 Transcript_120222/m.221110 type:complete len:400 (-) Transcript_120222:26-1225(-)
MKAKLSAEMVVAARRGDWTRVDSLVQRNANVNATGAHKISPLMVAAQKGRADVCASLIERRASPDAHDGLDQSTALMYAVRNPSGRASEEVVEALLAGGAAVDLRDNRAHTALLVAAEVGNSGAALLLLEYGADAEAVAHLGGVAVTEAALKDQVVNTFLHGNTGNAVQSYMKYRRTRDEQELKDALGGADPEEVQPWVSFENSMADRKLGQTLHKVRSESGSPEQAPPGLRKESLQPDRYEDGSEGSEEYEDEGEDEIRLSKYHLSRVAPLRPRDYAKPPLEPEELSVLREEAEALRQVVAHPKGSGDTALTIAARGGHADLCELLLRYSRDGAVSTPGRNAETALCAAAREGHVEAVRVLLSAYPAPEVHQDALRIAEAHGQEGTARVLRGYGTRRN